MFSIDYPFETTTKPWRGSSGHTLSDADRDKIAHGNAERILRIGGNSNE